MTLTNMKEMAMAHGGIIPPGVAMNMTDLEIRRAIKAGYLKEVPEKMDESKVKKVTTKATGKGKTDAKPKKAPAVMNPPAVEFSKEQKDDYSRLDGIIYDRMRDMQKSSFDIAFAVHGIYQNNYYKIDGYKNIYEYSRERYGIARGTTNNFINIVDRFADLDKPALALKPDYSGFSSTQLICMLGHTDDELKEKGITPEMSSRDIKKALKGTGSKGESINALNGGKTDMDSTSSDVNDDDTADDRPLNELQANVVFELVKSDLLDFPENPDEIEAYVTKLLGDKVKVIAKLLQLGHCIRVLDIV